MNVSKMKDFIVTTLEAGLVSLKSDTCLKLIDVVTKWWRLQFAQEFTSSQQFQHSRLIDVGRAVAQSPPWIGFVARLSRTHRFHSFNLTFVFSFLFHWIIIITHLLLHTYCILCHVDEKRDFTVSQFCHRECVRNVQQEKCVTRFFLSLQIFLFTAHSALPCLRFPPTGLSNVNTLLPPSFSFWTNIFHFLWA